MLFKISRTPEDLQFPILFKIPGYPENLQWRILFMIADTSGEIQFINQDLNIPCPNYCVPYCNAFHTGTGSSVWLKIQNKR